LGRRIPVALAWGGYAHAKSSVTTTQTVRCDADGMWLLSEKISIRDEDEASVYDYTLTTQTWKADYSGLLVIPADLEAGDTWSSAVTASWSSSKKQSRYYWYPSGWKVIASTSTPGSGTILSTVTYLAADETRTLVDSTTDALVLTASVTGDPWPASATLFGEGTNHYGNVHSSPVHAVYGEMLYAGWPYYTLTFVP
jgi:hypothetical protein